MRRKPRDAKQSFFSGGMGLDMLSFGVIMSVLTLGIYFVSKNLFGGGVATTMAFLTLGLTQLFHVFNVRSSIYSVFMRGASKQVDVLCVHTVRCAGRSSLCLSGPLNAFFNVVPLTGMQWLYVGAASFAIIPISEAIKLIKRLYKFLRSAAY